MSWCVVKRSPPAAEILIPTRSSGETSDPHALPTSGSPVTAITSLFTISRTICGFVLYCLIESASCTEYTIEGVGAGCCPCARPDHMAQNKTRATFRSSMTASTADGLYEKQRESQPSKGETGFRRTPAAADVRPAKGIWHKPSTVFARVDSPSPPHLRSHSLLRTHLPILCVLQGFTGCVADLAILRRNPA